MTGGLVYRFGILGPLEAVIDGRRREPTAPRQRALLALMLCSVGEPLSNDRILERLWGDDLPEGGPKTVGFHLSKLRDALEPDRERGSEGSLIKTTPAGYVLDVDPAAVDLHRFEQLADEAGALIATDPGRASLLSRDALGLIRGSILAEFEYEEFAQETIRRLDERRLRVLETRIEADLALGRHADVIPELELLVARNPLREGLRASLILALYRAGRQAEALRVFEDGRRMLAGELGIDPSRALRDLEQQILDQDPSLDLPVWAEQPESDEPATGTPPEAESVYSRLTEAGRAVARDVFLRLVSASSADRTRTVEITELHGLGHPSDALDGVLGDFGTAGVIRFDRAPTTEIPTVGISDPALLRAWGRLEAWAAGASAELGLRDRLAQLAREWEHNGRSSEYLVRGDRLKQLTEFAAASSLRLTAAERAFLDGGRRAARRSTLIARGRDIGIAAAVAPHLLPDLGDDPAEPEVSPALFDPMEEPFAATGFTDDDPLDGPPDLEGDDGLDLDGSLDGF